MADFWRDKEWITTIGKNYFNPEWNIKEPLDPEFQKAQGWDVDSERSPYIAHLYVAYNPHKGNKIYIGSTIAGPETRKRYHFNDAYRSDSKNYNAPFYQWMRENWSIRDDAEAQLELRFIRNIHLPRLRCSPEEEKKAYIKVIATYEKKFIATQPPWRLLNKNLLPKPAKAKHAPAPAPVRTEAEATTPLAAMLREVLDEGDVARQVRLLKAATAWLESRLP